MFHLFNRTYIEHEKWYTSKYEYLIVFKDGGKHPASRSADFPFQDIPSFQNFLDEKYSSSEEIFWEEIVKKPRQNKFVIFVDADLYQYFQIKYWKSIFDHLNVKDAYELHKFHYLDKHLKRFLYQERGENRSYDIEENCLLSFQEFEKRFESSMASEPLIKMNKGGVSFEYLLADYFYNKNSIYSPAFRTRLKNLCWKIWFNDIDILRSEIINSFYDIKRIIPEAKFTISDVTSVDHFIMNEPKLRWILDQDFNDENIDYVRDNYSPDLFVELAKSFRENWDLKILSSDTSLLEKIKIQDHILPTEQVFEERYLELLDENIHKNFGCRFVDEYLRNKANQLLPCFVYDKVRKGATEELKFLKLRRGAH